jgi:predicted methyltransferase
MLHRWLGPVLAGALSGCTPPHPATREPSPSAAPVEATHEAPAHEPTAPATGPATATTQPAPLPAPPTRVETTINDRYATQTSPKRWAAQFEREGREVFDHRDEIIAVLGLREGMAVADVGAGTGLFTLPLAERVGPEGTVYAVDVQPYFLEHIGKKARQAKLDNVRLVRAEQGASGLPEASVDLVIMIDTYHHVEQPAAYLASLAAALRPGGRLFVVDYVAIEGRSEPWLLEHVRATPAEFRAELEGAGFRFVREHEGLLAENFVFELERP